jgi:cell division transport system ATP-binding protein
MPELLIDYQNVSINRQELPLLEGVNLQVYEGEFLYLIGKVGSGKSSLMKSMYAEIPIASGEARVMDYDLLRLKKRDIPYLRRKIGIVFQDFQLLTDRTVYDNLLFVLRATGWKRKEEMEECIESVLKLVEMDNKGYKMPHQLSGGEQQRIVIARALLNSPRLILADEPTGNLDPETGARIVSLLRHISAMGTTVIMATHNLALTQEYPGRVVRIADRRVAEADPLALAEASPTASEA